MRAMQSLSAVIMAFLICTLLITSSKASAQNNWVDAGMPGRTIGSLRLALDSELGLLAMGHITVTNDYGAPVIPHTNTAEWDTLTGFRGSITDATRYGDTLLVTGNLYEVLSLGDTIPFSGIAAYYDGAWHAYGTFQSTSLVRRLKVLNGELYAIGAFRYADGQECNGVAKRLGGQWVPVGQLAVEPATNTPNLTDAVLYQGDLYVCGSINLAPNSERGIARFDGLNWSAPGGGILGGVAGGRAMAEYQGELYVGGSIYLSAGNAGHMIQRWDGSTWRAVGGHLRDGNNTTDGAARCYALFEHEGRLLAAGGFQYAGGVPAQTFAIWDGERWCGTGDTISNESHSIALHNDTIYLASGRVVNGDSTNTVVKWVSGPLQGNVCSEPVGVVEAASIEPSAFALHPSAFGAWTVLGLAPGPCRLDIYDGKGALVHQTTIAIDAQGKGRLQLSDLAPGVYSCRATSPSASYWAKIVIEQR